MQTTPTMPAPIMTNTTVPASNPAPAAMTGPQPTDLVSVASTTTTASGGKKTKMSVKVLVAIAILVIIIAIILQLTMEPKTDENGNTIEPDRKPFWGMILVAVFCLIGAFLLNRKSKKSV